VVPEETAQTGFAISLCAMANLGRPAVVAEMVSDMAAYVERRGVIAAAAWAATEVAAAQVGTVSEGLAGRVETAVTERRFVALWLPLVALGCAVAAATEGLAAMVDMRGEGTGLTEAAGVTD
jgi:hypothetical protein